MAPHEKDAYEYEWWSCHPQTFWLFLIWLTLLCILWRMPSAHAETHRGLASYYTVASCRREGTSGIMANGRRLDDEAFTAASWDYPMGQMVKVISTQTGKVVSVRITDHGPSRRLYRHGRILDLSQAAFQALASLREGVIPITVETLP